MKNKPRDERSFKDIEAEWYAKLNKDGFKDIEQIDKQDRPLLNYDSTHFIKPSVQARMSAREEYNKKIDSLINHRNFEKICKSITSHGNSSLTPNKVKAILELHRGGITERAIAQKIKRSQKCVHITIAKAQEWMKVS